MGKKGYNRKGASMEKSFKAYTEEQEKELKKIIETRNPIKELDGTKEQENILQEILGVLKRIEKLLTPEIQGNYMKEAVSSALLGCCKRKNDSEKQ